ncbi:MAG: acyl-CoA dehydrogenase family protein [Pseudomonadota bacterium]
MSQPDNFGFSEEAALLKTSARKFFEDKFPVSALHSLVAADHDPARENQCLWDQKLWQEMLALGWHILAVPESAGGVGMPVAAVAGLAEELGRSGFPCPLLSTISVCYVLNACEGDTELAFSEVMEGHGATLAITNKRGDWSAAETDCQVYDGKLCGTAWFVQDARKSERLLVSAQSEAGLCLYWVDVAAPGVALHADRISDLTRDQARIEFDNVDATLVARNGLTALNQAMPAIWTVFAADMVGAAEWQLQTTVDYANTRQQFDHPLGFFQAVKHPLVDVMIEIDRAKSLVYNAACAIDYEPERADQFAHMAKAAASDAAAFASSRSVQLHGGIGFTWECYVHLFFKRQKHSQRLFGDGAWHRARLADAVIGPVSLADP